ncbi:BTB/POZ domain-containing protein 3-like isoform 3, partial [Aphelenchoides avenae]
MRRRGPTESGPSAPSQTKRVRFELATSEPTTSRVGAPELSSRIGTWWMNPRMADVMFNVGPPGGVQELIPAHILVVAPASEVFNAMFLGSFEVPPTIDVPDGDPDAFKEMLRYIYTDRAVVTIG